MTTRAKTWMGVIALVLAACGGPALAMRDASSPELAAPSAGRARIVLAAPDAFRDVISVVDERGRYLGQLGGRTFTTLEVEPGIRRFYALVGANAYVVGGTVEAGRTYWVVAETPFARSLRWVAWSPGCGGEAAERLRGLRALEPDPAADRAAIERRLGNVPQRIMEADQDLARMSEAHRDARVLQPACGSEPAASAGGEDRSTATE